MHMRQMWSHKTGGFIPQVRAVYRADSRFVPSQCEAALLCNDVSHWLGAILESALVYMTTVSSPMVVSMIERSELQVKNIP